MKRVLIAFFMVLSGCASQIMDSYVGKSISEPVLDYGPPMNVLDLPDGSRAYQWKMSDSGAVPIVTPTTSTVYGPAGLATVSGSQTNWVPYSKTCVYTLLAKPNGKDWVVTGYRKPTFNCE
ncbi:MULTISPECIES: hypothetical protein [Thioclava]|nr:hypothetical protein [Thioclava sediminum]